MRHEGFDRLACFLDRSYEQGLVHVVHNGHHVRIRIIRVGAPIGCNTASIFLEYEFLHDQSRLPIPQL